MYVKMERVTVEALHTYTHTDSFLIKLNRRE